MDAYDPGSNPNALALRAGAISAVLMSRRKHFHAFHSENDNKVDAWSVPSAAHHSPKYLRAFVDELHSAREKNQLLRERRALR